MTRYHLAHLNLADPKYDYDSPQLAGFVNNLDRLNALADATPGFVWRWDPVEDDTSDEKYFGVNMLVNISVWEDLKSLRGFVFKSYHKQIMERRQEWFKKMTLPYSVLWWVPEGRIPTHQQARDKLELLRQQGPSVDAFTFKQNWPQANKP